MTHTADLVAFARSSKAILSRGDPKELACIHRLTLILEGKIIEVRRMRSENQESQKRP